MRRASFFLLLRAVVVYPIEGNRLKNTKILNGTVPLISSTEMSFVRLDAVAGRLAVAVVLKHDYEVQGVTLYTTQI